MKNKCPFFVEVLNQTPENLEEYQPLYKKTGGMHAALLFDSKGNLLLCSENMGPHNTVDKVIGAALIKEISCHDKILLSSGRGSLEMILKTARVGIAVFAVMPRPTSRAVKAAKFYNVTLIDIAKGSSRIYSHVRRIEGF